MSRLDDALEVLENTGPEYGGGLANHAPMAAEALDALGRDDAILPWVESYKERLRKRPEPQSPIVSDQWKEALGELPRVGDWTVFFERELEEAPWRDVLNVWTPRLAPGYIAAAAHGVIRTAHAVRSLSQSETPTRRRELAQGLAYWAATYQTLPAGPRGSDVTVLPSEAIERVEVLPRERQNRGGLITDGIEEIDSFPSFPSVIHRVDVSRDVSRFVSDLTLTFARVYVANAGRRFIALLHAVTGTGAARLLAPHLSPDATESLLRYAWQAGAALYVAFARTPRPKGIEPSNQNKEDLIDRAITTGDEHAIKLTETCLREHALNPKPEYLAAARHVVEAMAKPHDLVARVESGYFPRM